MNIDTKVEFKRLGSFMDESVSLQPEHNAIDARELERFPKVKWLAGARLWFLIVVVLPTLLTLGYYYALASDMYSSETSFVVRTPDKQSSTSLVDKMLQGAAGGGGENTSIVKDYMLSRDALNLLDKNDNIRAMLSRPSADFLSRFPGFFSKGSFEQLFEAYPKFVDVTIDETSGVATLRTLAFTPDDALRLSTSLVTYGEDLINRMNQRSEKDALAVARHEVDGAEKRLTDAQDAMTSFRNYSKVIDPSAASNQMLLSSSKMSAEVSQMKARLSAITKSTPSSPQIEVLRNSIQSLEIQIDAATGKMAGDAHSLTPVLSKYEQLVLQREFADKELAGALQSMISARVDAEKQHIFLEQIITPSRADYSLYPKRLKAVAIVFSVSLLLFALGWLLTAGAREHLA